MAFGRGATQGKNPMKFCGVCRKKGKAHQTLERWCLYNPENERPNDQRKDTGTYMY